MKQRLLVMNGHRLLQNELGGEWQVSKVDKAGLIKPGIYNISSAAMADKAKSYDGVVLHADRDFVFQQVGKAVVKHPAKYFNKAPVVGTDASIRYEADKVVAEQSSAKLGRHIKR